MLEKIATIVAQRLYTGLNASKEQYDTCRYGIEILLHTILSTLGLFAIGLYLRMFPEALIIITVFYINQSLGGGFHASSHMKCFITMALFLTSGLCILYIFPQIPWLDFCLSIAAIIALEQIPLVLHKNKQYLSAQSSHFVIRSRIAVGIFSCIVIICAVFKIVFIRALSIGLVLSAVSRIYAKYQPS